MLVRRGENVFEDRDSGRGVLFTALAIIPIAILTGVAIDLGVSFTMRQKLDAVAQSALASALAQSRSLRDVRYNVGAEEMESAGRGRADLVFNAQKPTLRDIRTDFTLRNAGAANVFSARVAYAASINTIFLRFFGLSDLDIEGEASTTWVARDALIEDTFDEQRMEVVAAGRKLAPAPAGWISNARTKIAGAPVLQLAAADRYDGPRPPDDVKIAVELDTADGNVAISKKIAVEPGAHQLRYWYRDRVRSDRLAPAWLCGTREEDIEWMSARDRSATGDTNRLSVYLTADSKDTPPSPPALNASARIDSCYSSGHRWIQRAVKIDVLTRGDYWLTFRGEGRPDGTGAAIANILFCREPCMDSGALPPPAANLPWSPGELIFEDKFLGDTGPPLANWTIWPGGAAKVSSSLGGLSSFVELDAPVGEGFENQKMGRAFLLTPGFYQLRYAYSGGPASPFKAPACNYFGLEAALQRAPRAPGADTRRITVIIDPDAPYLHPETLGAVGGGKPDWYTAGRLLERDSTGLKRQAIPDTTNAVDYCVGGPPNVVVNREVNFRIDKAGYYWVTFAADGPADGEGGRIGSVQLFAQGPRFAGQGIPRIVRHTERGDILTPAVGSLLIQPPAGSGQRPLYRVQVQ